MIGGFALENGRLLPVNDALANLANVVWIDLVSPTAMEESALERVTQ